jgi:hypothetical protein
MINFLICVVFKMKYKEEKNPIKIKEIFLSYIFNDVDVKISKGLLLYCLSHESLEICKDCRKEVVCM